MIQISPYLPHVIQEQPVAYSWISSIGHFLTGENNAKQVREGSNQYLRARAVERISGIKVTKIGEEAGTISHLLEESPAV